MANESGMKLHDFSDLEYWANRWDNCFPATYPPELFSYKLETKTTGWWIFKYEHANVVSICTRCRERIGTGHQCKDVFEYILERNRLSGT